MSVDIQRKGLPLYYLEENVFERALKRIRWLWDEFGHAPLVNSSGGKDSTVVLELTLRVAAERGNVEKVPVLWLDQESELQATVDYMKEVMYRPQVDPHWLQMPFTLVNAASHEQLWMNCWEEGKDDEWMHPKDPIAKQVNDTGEIRFAKMLDAYAARFPDRASLIGMRAEENPMRRLGLTRRPCYKWITWGRKGTNNVSFNPIYDWTWRDVWKAILDEGWKYNRNYDDQYRYGAVPSRMRVSSLNHEVSIIGLHTLQEIEPATYEALVRRVEGVRTINHVGDLDMVPDLDRLPFMFDSWREYRDYLLEHLLAPVWQEQFRKKFAWWDRRFPNLMRTNKDWHDMLMRAMVSSIVTNDIDFYWLRTFQMWRPEEDRLAEEAKEREESMENVSA